MNYCLKQMQNDTHTFDKTNLSLEASLGSDTEKKGELILNVFYGDKFALRATSTLEKKTSTTNQTCEQL